LGDSFVITVSLIREFYHARMVSIECDRLEPVVNGAFCGLM
jgi:hypothetical protein